MCCTFENSVINLIKTNQHVFLIIDIERQIDCLRFVMSPVLATVVQGFLCGH